MTNTVLVVNGDALEGLRATQSASMHCCVTSPPYWGLRDYGTAKWKGGSARCDHKPVFKSRATRPLGLLHGGTATIDAGTVARGDCRRCGAIRIDQQLGMERTPEEYVARLVEVFREVRRVLRDDGTLWLNLGDSYAGGGTVGRNDTGPEALARRAAKYHTGTGSGSLVGSQGTRPKVRTLKPKDLVGIPWRVAFALQADGWYLRSDIIWHKPNPMPESVTDRPTKAHEYLFLLSKSRKYYYDADAIKEASVDRESFTGKTQRTIDTIREHDPGYDGHRTRAGLLARKGQKYPRRNRRTVWSIATKPFKGAHFATFPPALIEPCILAGSPRMGTVLDPFAGAFTTALVAAQNARSFIGFELNPEYCAMGEARLKNAVSAGEKNILASRKAKGRQGLHLVAEGVA